jgi:hypothetical protein
MHLLDCYLHSPLQRIHNAYLMDAILQSNQFSPVQIRLLNYCRLQALPSAVTISDITDVSGSSLDQSKLHGRPSLMSSTTTLLHVNQDRPSMAKWTLWRKANLLWSDSSGNLHQPLGLWLMPIQQQRNQHIAYKLPTKMIVYQPRGHNDYTQTSVCLPFTAIPSNATSVQVKARSQEQWTVITRTSIAHPTDSVHLSHSATMFIPSHLGRFLFCHM